MVTGPGHQSNARMSLVSSLYTLADGSVFRDISPTSEIRVEIQRISGDLFWAKGRQANEVIDLQDLLNDYWSSDKHEFVVLSKL